MSLNRAVEYSQRHIRRHHFDHGDLGASGLAALRVHHPGCLKRQQTRLFDLDARVGDVSPNGSLFRDFSPERHAGRGAPAHFFERALGHADEAHAVMDAAWAQTALRDLEAAAFTQEHVGCGYAYVYEVDFTVTVRRVMVCENRP